jgi:hypothetical protein
MRLPLRTSVSGCDYLSQLMVRRASTGETRDAALCRLNARRRGTTAAGG